MVLGTYAELAQRTGVREATVKRLMAALVGCNVIREARRSQCRLNPDVVFRGRKLPSLSIRIRPLPDVLESSAQRTFE